MYGLKRRPLYTALFLLSAGTLINCSCEEEEGFIPAATYRPNGAAGTDLVFGPVSVNSEKTIPLLVDSNGRAPLAVIAANIVSGSQNGTWRVEVPEDLDEMVGLRPGSTATITVTFRPCPDAWEGDEINQDFDFNLCPGDRQAGDLNITDNTRAGAATFGLFGQPVQPPVAEVWCPVANNCGEADPQLRQCNGVTFGAVSSNQEPCDLVMELRNFWRNDKPVGQLEIERIEVLVQDYCCGDPGPIIPGEDIGFTIQTMDGAPLNPNSGSPLVVDTPQTASEPATTRFKFVFDGSRTGIWRGQMANMTGLRLYTNDPENRLISVPVTAQGSAPELQCTPRRVSYGDVEQRTTATATVTCRNGGDAALEISNIAVESGNPELEITTDLGTTQNITLNLFEQVVVWLDYTPQDTGVDAEELVLTSNDSVEPRYVIPISGGPIPEIDVQPTDALVFPHDPNDMPPIPPKTENLDISNVGFGDLTVSRLEICGPCPADDPNCTCNRDHPSVDDFSIDGCGGANPCDLNLTLCAPGPNCPTGSLKTLPITYDNNDISTTDLVELHIYSDDPSDPDHIVVLQAQDTPCLFPTVIIEVETVPACVNEPVFVNANNSNPGPMDATITGCEWFWLFTPGAPPAFNTQGTLTTSFIPTEDGAHILGARCTNSCGAESQTPGQETILVSNQCN